MREIADALLPLLEAEASKAERGPRTIFISGAQGIGKSTALARALKRLDVPAIGLGIDDSTSRKPPASASRAMSTRSSKHAARPARMTFRF